MNHRQTEKGILRNPYATEYVSGESSLGEQKFYESWYTVKPLDTPTQRHRYNKDSGMGRHFATAVLETLADNPDNFRQPLMIADAADRLAGNSDDEQWRTSLAWGMGMPIDADTAKRILREVSASGHHGGWPIADEAWLETEHSERYAAMPVETVGAAIAKLSRPEWVPGLVQRLEDLEAANRQMKAVWIARRMGRASSRYRILEDSKKGGL